MTVKKQTILILIAIAFFYTFLSLPYSYSENRVALIIGNEAYESSPLDNPVNDARAMAKILKRLGFEAIRKENINWQEMMKAITDFGEKMPRGGVSLFYFAGHGIQVNGKNYLIPVESDIRHEKQISFKAVDAGLVLAEMENARNGLNIVILDACRDNPFARSFRSSTQGLAYMDAPIGSIIAYATAPGRTANDGSGKNGLYTSELIKQMKIPGQRLIDMFMNVRKAVKDGTQGEQIPWESISLTEPFYFLANSGGVTITEPQKETSLTVHPNVSDAIVWVNGKKMGVGLIRLRVQPGWYRIKVSRDGYQTYETRVKVEKGESDKVIAYLEKIETEPVSEPPKSAYGTKKDKKITNSLGMEFVYIPPGTFMMGSPLDEAGRGRDEKLHHVSLTRGFYMQTTEVTVGQWRVFVRNADLNKTMESKVPEAMWTGIEQKKEEKRYYWNREYNWIKPGFSQTDRHPVTYITWNDINIFIKWLNQKEGKSYRLPTETEWEYVARAGSKTAFANGDIGELKCGYDPNLCAMGWYCFNSDKKTHSVALKQANAWGLYDMHGNVSEWCQDRYSKYPTEHVTDPASPENGSGRVLRGGSWYEDSKKCRSASRSWNSSGRQSNTYGFRLIMSSK